MEDVNIKRALGRIWKRSKVSYLILLVSLAKLLPMSWLRLGKWLLAYPRKKLEDKAVTKFEPSKEDLQELEFYAWYAINVFQWDSSEDLAKAYPQFTDHAVDEYRTCRYAVMRNGSDVYISIRGSTTEDNWVDGFTSEMVYSDELENNVHMGYGDVAKGIMTELVAARLINPMDNIHITGGSMGGAVSILLGWYLDDNIYAVKKIWAFANPRVSDGDYGHLPVVNVLNMKDPVVYIPSFSLWNRYRHQGKRLCYTQGEWKWYNDSWQSDVLMSPYMMTESVKVKEHSAYGDLLVELKKKLGY